MRIVVVGVCAAGKSTLVNNLRALKIDACSVPQEHSVVKGLWRRKHPDLLVMLDATLPVIRKRRIVAWGQERLDAQHQRLKNAFCHADLFLETDDLTKNEVVERIIALMAQKSSGLW